MELRPYQEKGVKIGVNNLKAGKDPSIIVAATGAGKSHIIANICKELNAPTLILQPSKEILDQNYAKLLQTGIRDVSIYSASRNSKIIDNYTYATIGSIKNYSLFKHFKYILMDECFPYDQRICTDKGRKSIGFLAKCFNNPTKEKYNLPKVLSYNETTKKLEYKDILNAKFTGYKETITLYLSQLRKIKVTPNHPFLTNKGWINAGNLKKGDIIISTDNSNAYYPILNIDQKEILKGSILGDGHISKVIKTPNTSRLRVIHGDHQKDYCLWKANMFHSKVDSFNNNGYSKKIAHRFNTNYFYLDTGNFTKEYAINNLTPKSLAIAYCDDGTMTSLQYGAKLYSTAQSKELTDLLSLKLLSLGIENKPAIAKSSSTKKEYYYININKKGLYNLCKIIAPYVHTNLSYKIIDEFKSLVGTYQWDNDWGNYYGAVIVKTETGKILPVYNLTIKDNETYVIASKSYDKQGSLDKSGLIVHNCHLLNPKSLDSMYMKFFKAVNPIGICGLTATPYRRVSKFYKEGDELYYTSGFEMLNRIHPFFFKSISYKVELAELIAMNYLAPVKYFVSKEEPKTLKINSTGSDFTDKSLFITSDLRKTKVAKAITYANEVHKRFIVFVPSVANAYNLTEALKKNGIYIPTISAETPAKERDNLLLRYRNGEFKGMLNCGVFLIGLDVPSIDAVIWDRNTAHPAILYQGIGRGLRIDPANPNKILHVYDVSGSILKTGPVEAFRIIKEDGFKDMLVTTVDGQQKQLTGRPVFTQKVSNLKYYNRT
jgi:superfamily II DNA or RNA helicase